MISNLSIKFYLNELKAKGGTSPIYLRITVNRKKAEVATGYYSKPKEWENASQEVWKNNSVNKALVGIKQEVHDIAQRLEKEKKPLTARNIKNYLTYKDKLDAYLLDSYSRLIDGLKKGGEVVNETIVGYTATKKHLENFLQGKCMNDILIENIDYSFIKEFDLFLLNKQVNKSENTMMRNTVNKHHTRLRTVIINAIKEGFIVKNPYSNFKLKKVSSTRTFLTNEELQRILTHSLGGNESLIKVRDIFIFSVYTGLRFEDAQQLTIDKIAKENKKYVLRIEQEKTKELVNIPLLEPAIRIINKYENSPERKVLHKVLPAFSNQKLNAYLKVIADLTGIKKNLTHHVARHTCATTVLLSNDVPIEAVSKWLGHTNYQNLNQRKVLF
jgi:integrase/recombinase XerD